MNRHEDLRLGIDIGASSLKAIMLAKDEIIWKCTETHYGRPLDCLLEILGRLPADEVFSLSVTGSNSILLSEIAELRRTDDIPAVISGVRRMVPAVGSVIEIGSQSARFITNLHQAVPSFSVNEHCAGGTGSFFEDQMSRLGFRMEEYSSLCRQASYIPRLSGRCAVFAKTDIIHRQQEGVAIPDILLGLCYAMIRNYKAVIVRSLPVEKPVAFCGGVTLNEGVIQAIREVFSLRDDELIVPEDARYSAAIGAAEDAEGTWTRDELTAKIHALQKKGRKAYLPKLTVSPDLILQDPAQSGEITASGAALGIDIGSTSTDLVMIDPHGSIIDMQYLRTAGDPEKAVRKGLASIRERYGEISFLAVGVTGSGRERIGRMIGADAIRDEITAQAKAAAFWVPEADTVFEIGGQDSKYISLQDGQVRDFQMNKICAAGTGSFIEEQAARMNIPLGEFGPLALSGEKPADLGERCTVFIETAIASAQAEGVSEADIAAGLCCSIVRNYLHKVVENKPVGRHIVLQGGVAYNPAITAAFEAEFPGRIVVNPCFSVSGAFGAAMLALETDAVGKSTFRGFHFSSEITDEQSISEEIQKNIAFYRKAGELLTAGYDGHRDPGRKTVGIPFALMIHKFFPMAKAYFESLGYNVLLSDPTNEDTIRLAQEYASGETCYPVKLIYGHMRQLIDAGVDYIFMPGIHTMKHARSHVVHNYGCVYMQTAPANIARILKLEEKGITLLNPIFDLDFGKEAMATAMIGLGRQLNKSKPECAKALMSGAMAVRKYDAAVEKHGKTLLASLKPEDKVLVLVTRNYGINDPVLNMGIPELLLERGYKVITLSHLPAHDLDISDDYSNLYWPFGQHILSGAKIIANHPNLYAVYLTNHGCGPDSMLSHLFRHEMHGKPYLRIEVDEHFSKVGVITRMEAFLNALRQQPVKPLPKYFDLLSFPSEHVSLPPMPSRDMPVYIPDYGLYSKAIAAYLQKLGYTAELMPGYTAEMLTEGRKYTSAKEYLPYPALLGQILHHDDEHPGEKQYLLFQTRGSEADGQYARVILSELKDAGRNHLHITAPSAEEICRLPQAEILVDEILKADLLNAAPADQRKALTENNLPLKDLAERISRIPVQGSRLLAVGTPLVTAALDEGILNSLELKGYTVLRTPLSEYLWMLWRDQDDYDQSASLPEYLRKTMCELHQVLQERSPFAEDVEMLQGKADAYLPGFAGANGRYRFARIISADNADAILHVYPRYENTAMVMDMRGLRNVSALPVFDLAIDGDWDETAAERLRSFLYYCRREAEQK